MSRAGFPGRNNFMPQSHGQPASAPQ
jgi:hypothetical protein